VRNDSIPAAGKAAWISDKLQVTGHKLMAALCYNLKKYMKFQGRSVLAAVQTSGLKGKEAISGLFRAIFDSIRGFLSQVFYQAGNTSPKTNLAGMSSF
jgi:hypothetical protein